MGAKTGRWYRAQVAVAYATGAVFFLILILYAVLLPNPSPFQSVALRIILALTAAAFAGSIPGSLALSANSTSFKLLRAGGAIAVFVLFYFFSPSLFR